MFETHRDDGRQSFDAPGAKRDVRDNLLDETSLQKNPIGVVPELKESMWLAAVTFYQLLITRDHNIWIKHLNGFQSIFFWHYYHSWQKPPLPRGRKRGDCQP